MKAFFSYKHAMADPRMISVGITATETYIIYTHGELDAPLYKDSVYVGDIVSFLMRAEQFNR